MPAGPSSQPPSSQIKTTEIANVPKRIWILWLQGLEHMPPVPRACVESWVKHNPSWDIKILTAESLCDWADSLLCLPTAQSLQPYRLSDLTRVNLLARHGGVWVDATCYCMKPLDEWLPDCLGSGFFAFDRPGPDRVMANWFLASPSNGYIPRKMFQVLAGYMLGRTMSDAGWRGGARKALDRALNNSVRTTSVWFAWPLPQLGISPYYSFHYLFNRLTKTDATFRRIWQETVKVSSDGPHRLQFHGFDRSPSAEIIADIEQRRVPLYKLNWRIDPATLPPSSALNVLLRDAGR